MTSKSSEKYKNWEVLEDDYKHVICREIKKHHHIYITVDREKKFALLRLYDVTPQNMDRIDLEAMLDYHESAFDCIPDSRYHIINHYTRELEKKLQELSDTNEVFVADDTDT